VYTPGSAMSADERNRAFRDMIADLVGTEVTTAVLVERWMKIPGMTSAQRPALSRRISWLVEIGAATKTAHGRYQLAEDALTRIDARGGYR